MGLKSKFLCGLVKNSGNWNCLCVFFFLTYIYFCVDSTAKLDMGNKYLNSINRIKIVLECYACLENDIYFETGTSF